MRLLVHIAGESDFLLDLRSERDERIRAGRVRTRDHQVTAALAGPGGPAAARHLLATGGWADDHASTPAPSPLLGALAGVEATPDLDVVVIGTSQQPPHPLDTLPIARTLAEVLAAGTAEASPVRTVTAVPALGLCEAPVVAALTRHLDQAPRYSQALVTWGSGATALTMGALTALSRAGLPWVLVATTGPAAPQTIDPLQRLDTDPVVGVLVRWRMFAALDDLASQPQPMVRLTDAQRDLVRRAADRHRAGMQARDCAALRAVLADAVVRRDGTASLAVRRYLTSRYEELLAADQVNHPDAKDLLRYAVAMRGPGRTLGRLKYKIEKNRDTDPVIRASVGLPSYQSLFTPEFDALQEIGKGSHNLRPPGPGEAQTVGTYLARYDIDGSGWGDADLPDPPISPADSVLAVWLAGDWINPRVGTVGQQMIDHGPPATVLDHIGVDQVRVRSIIFGIPGEQGSLHHADQDAARLRAAAHEAWPEPIDLTDAAPTTAQRAIEDRLTRDTAALLLIPTGRKPVILALLHAMRRVGARHGIPLFVRQTADPPPGGTHTDVYLWPALTGGDLALLVAAREALRALELDVAWRLLAASAIDPDVTDNARRLAAAFASRQPLSDAQWPQQPDPAPTPDLTGRTLRMIAQRLALVDDSLAQMTNQADRIRLLVLAADALEASIAATQPPGKRPGTAYREFRDALGRHAHRCDAPTAGPARILLLLNEARDRAPITHGTASDPDAVVAHTADHLARAWSLPAADSAALPRDVASLVRQAIAAATATGLGQPDQPGNLTSLRQEIDRQIAHAMIHRGPR